MNENLMKHLPKDAQHIVANAFKHMKIAEEEIEAAKQRYPNKAAQLHNSFKLLCPPETFASFTSELYRAHAKELLQRIARGKDLSLATRAELCIALSEASFLAPLRNDFYCFYSQCFRAVFPKKYGEIFKGWPSRPSFKGALKELKHKLQRKFQSKRGIGLDEKRSNESKKKGRKSHVTQSL